MQEADKHDQKYNKCQKYNKHDHFFYIDQDNYIQYPRKKQTIFSNWSQQNT